jgi:hypothetical protein
MCVCVCVCVYRAILLGERCDGTEGFQNRVPRPRGEKVRCVSHMIMVWMALDWNGDDPNQEMKARRRVPVLENHFARRLVPDTKKHL